MRLFAITIFLSAFLLFQVQPLIGKYILPWFGGGPGVWTTCLLFFQTVLLGGYAYAHVISTRLKPRNQAWVHLGLLVVALVWLPINPGVNWKPAPGAEPVTSILLLLSACIGVPYLTLSATGPLLQRWFSLAHPDVPPYRLYSLSNVGSLLALLSYPFAIEPFLPRSLQGHAWSGGFVVFALVCGVCAWRIRGFAVAPENASGGAGVAEAESATGPLNQFMWMALPAVASMLLLAVTNKLCLDVAVVPFLWIVPLALYLLSFILCFDHPRWYSPGFFSALFALGCGVICYFLTLRSVHLPLQVTGYALTLFAACMLCHGELFRLRPGSRQLTRYYLFIAAGGAVGSLLVAVVAPLVLPDYFELQIGLTLLVYLIGVLSLLYRSKSLASGVAAGVLASIVAVPALRASGTNFIEWIFSFVIQLGFFFRQYWGEILFGFILLVVCFREGRRIGTGPWRRGNSAFPLVMTFLIGSIFTVQITDDRHNLIESVRNFYGTLKLRQYNATEPANHFYLLSHGETTHGLQFVNEPRRGQPASYYGATSGVGRAIDLLPGNRRIGVVGLGSGTLAVYGRPGDTVRFYDINPAVVPIARDRFTYIEHSAARVDIILGDARLSLEDELRRGESQQFDLLALDAFSSDAIPVHLLTREAMAIYLQHLKPSGILAVHVSNRYLNLKPVVAGLVRHFALESLIVSDDPPSEQWWQYGSDWILVTKDRKFLKAREFADATEIQEEHPKVVEWTDDYASLAAVVK